MEKIENTLIEEFTQLLMDSNPQYIFWKDVNGVYLGCNKLYADFCDLKTTDEIIGKTDDQFIRKAEAQVCSSSDKAVMGKGDALLNFEEYITNAHGESRWYSINKIPLKNKDGEVIGVLGTMTDVTELKSKNQLILEQSQALEKRLEELKNKNKELEEFNYIVAHDLQEPIRNILSFTDLLESNKAYNEEYVDHILSNGQRMGNLLNALLDYYVVGSIEKELVRVDMNEVIQDVKEILQPIYNGINYEIKFQDLPVINGFKEELISLFQNIITNSIKYRQKNRNCLIEIYVTGKDKESIEICVKDNGIGFHEDQTDKILQIFQRLHQRDNIDGLGIGLSICSKIMNMHNGHLKIESTPEIGTSVFLTFKL